MAVQHHLASMVQLIMRRLWCARGVDVTIAMSSGRCVVVSPHPDDETLGCAVTVMRKRDAGTEVSVIIATDGSGSHPQGSIPTAELVRLRRAEAVRACAALGVRAEHLTFLDYPDGSLETRVDELAGVLAAALGELHPEQLLVPVSCDGHPDHDAVNEAARRAVASMANAPEVLEYPVWLWKHWPFTRAHDQDHGLARRAVMDPLVRLFEVRPRVVRTDGYLERKQAAIAEYRTQVGRDAGVPTLDPSFLRHFTGSHEVLLAGGSLRHLGKRSP